MFPRGGGVWDQDPILMRDFRIIRRFDMDWKNAQHEIAEAEAKLRTPNPNGGPTAPPSGQGGLGSAMNQFLEQLEEDGTF